MENRELLLKSGGILIAHKGTLQTKYLELSITVFKILTDIKESAELEKKILTKSLRTQAFLHDFFVGVHHIHACAMRRSIACAIYLRAPYICVRHLFVCAIYNRVCFKNEKWKFYNGHAFFLLCMYIPNRNMTPKKIFKKFYLPGMAVL